jgi:hypothetical protein
MSFRNLVAARMRKDLRSQNVRVNSVALRGFEHHTFICSECHITARRVVFTRHGREEDPKPLQVCFAM